MGQKQLFDARGKETHGIDKLTRVDDGPEIGTGRGRAKVRAWCGKNVAPDRVAGAAERPTCYQCALVFDRAAGASSPAPARSFRPWEVWQGGHAILHGLTESAARNKVENEVRIASPGGWEARQARGPMTIHECASLLLARHCFGCDGMKREKMAFCLNCWRRLSEAIQRRLYQRFGEGFESAYSDAMARLGRPVDYGQ